MYWKKNSPLENCLWKISPFERSLFSFSPSDILRSVSLKFSPSETSTISIIFPRTLVTDILLREMKFIIIIRRINSFSTEPWNTLSKLHQSPVEFFLALTDDDTRYNIKKNRTTWKIGRERKYIHLIRIYTEF